MNIWKTAEAESWSRGFGYEDYSLLCSDHGISPLCEEAYMLVKAAFEAQACEDE